VHAPCHLEQQYRCILGVEAARRSGSCGTFFKALVHDLKTSCHVFEEPVFATSFRGWRRDRKTHTCGLGKWGTRSRVTSRGRQRTCRHHRRTRVHEGCNPHSTRGMRDRSIGVFRRSPFHFRLLSRFRSRTLNSMQFTKQFLYSFSTEL